MLGLALAGPLGARGAVRVGLGLLLVMVSGLLVHVGALAVWLALGAVPWDRAARRWPVQVATGLVAYVVVWSTVAPGLAALSDRVALPCVGGPLRAHSVLYCVAHRNYVRSALAEAATRSARRLHARNPGAVVRYLDGGFPTGMGVPLLPHLSHGDGLRLDLALQWRDDGGQPTSGSGSPVGYFGYAALPDGTDPACPPRWSDLRWDLDALQPVLARNTLDVPGTSALVQAVLDEPGIDRVLVEPHVAARLGLRDRRIRFQGCHAARHDDHVHIEL